MDRPALGTLLALAFVGLRGGDGRELPPLPAVERPLGLPALATPPDPDEERAAELGRHLFFDPVLSADRSLACASCHVPERGFADAAAFSAGVGGARTLRNAPSLFNRALGTSFFWDGRAATLEQQVLMPIADPREMGLALDDAVERLRADTELRAAFEATFGTPPDRDELARALAAYVRRLVLGDSPVDRFRAGAFDALSDEERAGLWFYESRGGCWRCHAGANFSDEDFHNTGVGARDGVSEEGRAAVTGVPEDRGRFKTPTLRGVTLSAPYMHDGSLADLEAVVAFYRGGGRANANLDPLLAPLEMTDADAHNLVAFLRALSRSAEGPTDR